MSADGESSPHHAVVPTDAPGTASTVDMVTNKHMNITLAAHILKEHQKILQSDDVLSLHAG